MKTKYQIEINVCEVDTGEVVERWGSASPHVCEFDDAGRAHDFAFALAKVAAAFGDIEPGDPTKRAREQHGERLAFRAIMNRPW